MKRRIGINSPVIPSPRAQGTPRLFSLGIAVALFAVACSTEPPATPPQVIEEETDSRPVRPPVPPPPPELTVVFEFEGIARTHFSNWRSAAFPNLRIRQELLRLDETGAPVNRGDVYVLSPRTIPHFIARGWVAPLDNRISLNHINPTFTFHRFDPGNRYTVPFRWSPLVLLKAVPPESEEATPAPTGTARLPGDSPIEDALGLNATPTDMADAPPNPPALPDPAAYRQAWDDFISGKYETLWIPAACPLRNLGNEGIPKWNWEIPGERTVIVFDHLAVDSESTMTAEALSLVAHLLSDETQSKLPDTSGYFPVTSDLGKETKTGPVALPKGDWFQRSSFITGTPFFPPPKLEIKQEVETQPTAPSPPLPESQTTPPE